MSGRFQESTRRNRLAISMGVRHFFKAVTQLPGCLIRHTGHQLFNCSGHLRPDQSAGFQRPNPVQSVQPRPSQSRALFRRAFDRSACSGTIERLSIRVMTDVWLHSHPARAPLQIAGRESFVNSIPLSNAGERLLQVKATVLLQVLGVRQIPATRPPSRLDFSLV
jgi:hypothetical protein